MELFYITEYMGLFYIKDYLGLFYIRIYMGLLYIPEYLGCSTSETTWHLLTWSGLSGVAYQELQPLIIVNFSLLLPQLATT